ncbi:MAG: serine hydrolase domain-containing protein [Acetobacteraceae bacterium]
MAHSRQGAAEDGRLPDRWRNTAGAVAQGGFLGDNARQMTRLSRRAMLGLTLSGSAGLAYGAVGQPPQQEGTEAERAAMAEAATGFMIRYAVPGLSVAIARAGKLAYAEAFGLADREAGEKLTPAHRFRIASVTKPITSAAIFTLIEQGRLHLGDRISGQGGILGIDYGGPPYNPYVGQITVEQLLTHTGGGWPNDGRDPMFRNPQMDHARLIAWTLRSLPLDTVPGTTFAYSNFGYCLLGRVIETLSGQPYETYVRDAVLRRCGIEAMQIAGNTLAERQPGEVRYYAQNDGDPYGMNVRRMDSHGGWIARPADLVRFAMHVDGFATTPDILLPSTLRVMTTPTAANPHYARGWAVNQYGHWWHSGSLPGTATIMVRTRSGFCWAALTNTRRPQSDMEDDLDRLVWIMARKVAAWKA